MIESKLDLVGNEYKVGDIITYAYSNGYISFGYVDRFNDTGTVTVYPMNRLGEDPFYWNWSSGPNQVKPVKKRRLTIRRTHTIQKVVIENENDSNNGNKE